jgi:uncharacterized protein
MAKDDGHFRILSLDGGGAKGFYTLGVLKELEAKFGPLHELFDLIYGTSTGSIIGTMLSLGRSVDEIIACYRKYVPSVMSLRTASAKSFRLGELSSEVFKDDSFEKVRTGIGIVATKWVEETPLIFKGDVAQAHGRKASFVPGFGVPLGEAVQASCSAYPYFKRKQIYLYGDQPVLLFDGGFCANNPSLYAIADAVRGYEVPLDRIRVLNVGVGEYPFPKIPVLSFARVASLFPASEITQKTFNVNTQSMEQLRQILFGDIQMVRVSEAFTTPEMAADMFEHNLEKLNLIHQRGRSSYGKQETLIDKLLQ